MNETLMQPLTKAEEQQLTGALSLLLARRVALYTMGESSSISEKTGERLLRSVLFTLGLSENDPAAPAGRVLLGQELNGCFQRKKEEISRKLTETRRLWAEICLRLPEVQNQAMLDTVQSIGGFFRAYNLEFFAHEIPCDIDYQLSVPVDEAALGVDYLALYLQRLRIENDFIRSFSPAQVRRLLHRVYPDSFGQLVNLFTPVLWQAIGVILAGGLAGTLSLTERMRLRLLENLRIKTAAEQTDALTDAVQTLGDQLGCSVGEKSYFSAVVNNGLRRFQMAVQTGKAAGLFCLLSVPDSPVRRDG